MKLKVTKEKRSLLPEQGMKEKNEEEEKFEEKE